MSRRAGRKVVAALGVLLFVAAWAWGAVYLPGNFGHPMTAMEAVTLAAMSASALALVIALGELFPRKDDDQ